MYIYVYTVNLAYVGFKWAKQKFRVRRISDLSEDKLYSTGHVHR